MPLIMRGFVPLVDSLVRGEMHRIVVNLRTANVFNRILETQKSTRKREKNAKICACKTRRPGVYHARINHDAALGRIYGMFRSVEGAAEVREGRACTA